MKLVDSYKICGEKLSDFILKNIFKILRFDGKEISRIFCYVLDVREPTAEVL